MSMPPSALALVGEVGDDGVQLGAQLLRQRHRPHRLAGAVGGRDAPASRKASSLAMTAGDACAERDHLGAGQGGDVDDRVGLAPRRRGTMPSPRTMPALGVGVEHLDGRAAAHRHDVARALGRAARHVLGEAEVAGDGDRQAELGDGEDRAGDGGGAGHVGLHRQHAGRPA